VSVHFEPKASKCVTSLEKRWQRQSLGLRRLPIVPSHRHRPSFYLQLDRDIWRYKWRRGVGSAGPIQHSNEPFRSRFHQFQWWNGRRNSWRSNTARSCRLGLRDGPRLGRKGAGGCELPVWRPLTAGSSPEGTTFTPCGRGSRPRFRKRRVRRHLLVAMKAHGSRRSAGRSMVECRRS
jgi:hypothetical protein